MLRSKDSRGKTGSLREVGVHFKQYAMVAAGGLGMTGGHALSGPLQAQIGINDPCNHRCVFCWDHPPEDRENEDTTKRFGLERPGVMSLEQFKGIVDDLYKLGTRRVDLIGRGEPLLNRAALEMIRYVKGRNMQLLLCTNASRLSESIAKGLVAAGVDRVNVSLNAGTPETYPHIHVTETPQNYLRVKRNLRYLSDCKVAAGSGCPGGRLRPYGSPRWNARPRLEPRAVPGTVGLDPRCAGQSRGSGRTNESRDICRHGSCVHGKRDRRSARRSMLRGLVFHGNPGERIRAAVLPVYRTHRSSL
jgi:Radical SAM superfamily